MIGKVEEVFRKSDSVIVVRVMVEEKVWNIVSAYAPQIGSEESQKEEFWRKMDEVIQRIPGAEEIVIGGDMNGYVGVIELATIEYIEGVDLVSEMMQEEKYSTSLQRMIWPL